MNIFESLIGEFAEMTGLKLAPEGGDCCALESNGVVIVIQYRSAADDVVLAATVAGEGGEELSQAAYQKALELAYDGRGTAGAQLGLLNGALILTRHLPIEGLDAARLGVRLTEFADTAESLKAEIAAAQDGAEESMNGEKIDFACNQFINRV